MILKSEETMKLNFWMSNKPRRIHCRRGDRVFRERDVPANTNQFDYPALSLSVIEMLSTDGELLGSVEIVHNVNQPHTITPLQGKGDEQLDNRQPEKAGGKRPTPKNDDNVQPVGGKGGPDGRTVPRPVRVQVPPVDAGDARQRSTDERGPKSGPDGVHSDAPEQKPVHDRRETRVSAISTTDKDAGRDGLLSDSVRPVVGKQPASAENVQRREERGDKTGGDSGPVHPGK